MTKAKVFTYDDLREHADRGDAYMCINGKVYDVTEFAKRHPGGNIIYNAVGIDATILFETHHSMVPDLKRLHATLDKYCVGEMKDFHRVARFDTPFAKALLSRCRAHVHKRVAETWWIGRRWDAFTTLSVLTFFASFFTVLYKVATTGSLLYCALFSLIMAIGHLVGHASNHHSISEYSFVNNFCSKFCTNTWGLREQYWTFSHLVSHHCYNYAERDYMLEQHVPTRFFRIRPEDPYKPLHKYQHYFYLLSPVMAFFIGALRWDCAPWCFAAPIVVPLLTKAGVLRAGHSSAPAPQFTAAGSTHAKTNLLPNEDGVGLGGKYHVRETWKDTAVSLVMANVIFLPLFVNLALKFGFLQATLLLSFTYGLQSAIIIRTLLLQHLSEDIILKPIMTPEDDWYAMQVEASTSICAPIVKRQFLYGVGYQIEHHMFPCMAPQLLHEIRPIVMATAKEFGVHYNGFSNNSEAQKSVYERFRQLSVKPASKKD